MNDEQLRRYTILEQVARERAQVAQQERERCRKVAGLFKNPDDFAALCKQMLEYTWKENPGPDQQDTINAARETWMSAFHYFAIANRFTGSLVIYQMRGKGSGEFKVAISNDPNDSGNWRRFMAAGTAVGIYPDDLDDLWHYAAAKAKKTKARRKPPYAARVAAPAKFTRGKTS